MIIYGVSERETITVLLKIVNYVEAKGGNREVDIEKL